MHGHYALVVHNSEDGNNEINRNKNIMRAEHWCLEGELTHREGPFLADDCVVSRQWDLEACLFHIGVG